MNDARDGSHSFGIRFSEDETRSDGDVLGPLDKAELDDGSLARLEDFGRVNPFYDDCLANIPDVDGRLKVLPDSMRMKKDVNVRFETETGAGQRRRRVYRCRRR